MTLQELYAAIDGDYRQALNVLRIEKLLDKHIRKFPDNTIFADLQAAARAMASGMNAHLPKPIEPEILYQTLTKFIAKDH